MNEHLQLDAAMIALAATIGDGDVPEGIRIALTAYQAPKHEILTPRAAAIYCGLSHHTMANKRSYGTGPRFIKPLHGRVYYYRADLDEWLQSGMASSTAQAAMRHLIQPNIKKK